jgi:hypothetical protein
VDAFRPGPRFGKAAVPQAILGMRSSRKPHGIKTFPLRRERLADGNGGQLGGKLETGRALDYFESGDDNRKLCSLYLGIMDRMGVELAEFGDAETRLAGF